MEFSISSENGEEGILAGPGPGEERIWGKRSQEVGRVGRPEAKMAKKKLHVAENFRHKVLYLNLSVFLYCTVITLYNPQIFIKVHYTQH